MTREEHSSSVIRRLIRGVVHYSDPIDRCDLVDPPPHCEFRIFELNALPAVAVVNRDMFLRRRSAQIFRITDGGLEPIPNAQNVILDALIAGTIKRLPKPWMAQEAAR
jgi:hypothetical protein